MIPYISTPNGFSIFINGRPRVIDKSHVNYAAVAEALKEISTSTDVTARMLAHDRLVDLVDVVKFIAKVTEGRVQVSDNEVRFDGVVCRTIVAQRLLEILHAGQDIRPLARFLDRLLANPNGTAIEEMYLWLESGNMPLTDDGCFLAYKKVKADFTSSHRGPDGQPFHNDIGTTPSMPREQVDPDRHSTCSSGLHFCSWQYLPNFGLGGESKVIVLKVAPEDVVAIPSDYNNSKGRAWRYVVLGEVPEDECQHLFANAPIVSSFGLYDNTQDVDPSDFDGEYDEELDDTCENNCGCTDGTEVLILGDGREVSNKELQQLVSDFGEKGAAHFTKTPLQNLRALVKRLFK